MKQKATVSDMKYVLGTMSRELLSAEEWEERETLLLMKGRKILFRLLISRAKSTKKEFAK